MSPQTPVTITSTANPRIKNVVRLTTSRRHRDKRRQTVVEGAREVRRCLEAGVSPKEVYICPELVQPEDHDLVAHLAQERTPGA
ncbi:MAG: hypothetical protein D6790_19880, partial [Caldilineae bacterium]